jgi:hypothetical protein
MMTWTLLQIESLIENYGTLRAVSLAKLIGKSENAIRIKAKRMKLNSTLPHKVSIDLGTINNLRVHGLSARAIGRLIGCTHQGVRYAETHHTIARE